MSVRFVIDPVEFVNNSSVHRDKISLHDLTRLHDILFDDEGSLDYQISGDIDSHGKPSLILTIEGSMNLVCQRCLSKMTHKVEIENHLYLAKNNIEFDQINEDNSVDAILAVPELDIIDLIEEEIILSLPISPRHSDELCVPYQSDLNESTIDQSPQRTNPFAALSVLKKTN
ncbi:MAG: YceD family protein [Nitrosomonas sp.]|nr:YceD family protein [Nitrosomonas sp.]